jgi:monoamine oxidase
MTELFDFIIIGGGIAGLYSDYLIKKNCKNARFIILEANQIVGGRMGEVEFEGTSVVTGAGIGRKRKDKILRELLQESLFTK